METASQKIARIMVLLNNYGLDVSLDKMPEGLRLGNKYGRFISPRLHRKDFALWLDGFAEGVTSGQDLACVSARKQEVR